MSDTPRTDLQVQVAQRQRHDGYVHASFARVLEGENADLKAAITHAVRAITQIKDLANVNQHTRQLLVHVGNALNEKLR